MIRYFLFWNFFLGFGTIVFLILIEREKESCTWSIDEMISWIWTWIHWINLLRSSAPTVIFRVIIHITRLKHRWPVMKFHRGSSMMKRIWFSLLKNRFLFWLNFRYFIERTQSARCLLDKAVELCPEVVVCFFFFCRNQIFCFLFKENDDAASNSDDLEDDEPIESVAPTIGLKNPTGQVSSRRPNSPIIVSSGSGSNSRISSSPSNSTVNKNQHHHSRS